MPVVWNSFKNWNRRKKNREKDKNTGVSPLRPCGPSVEMTYVCGDADFGQNNLSPE